MNSYSSISFLFNFSVIIPSIYCGLSTYNEYVILVVVRVTIGVHIVSCGTFFAGQAWKRQKAATDICNSLGFAFKAIVRIFNSVIPYLICNHSNDLTKTFWANLHLKFIAIYRQKLTVLWCQNSFGVRLPCALARCSLATVRWAGFK